GMIAMSIGSSWTTAGTIGVGLVGIAAMLGVSTAITGGAVISGAYLGDKLSPLSETTIMTSQMVEVDVREHIKRQAWTSIPAFIIAFALFLIIGWVRPPQTAAVETGIDLEALDQFFNISLLNLLLPRRPHRPAVKNDSPSYGQALPLEAAVGHPSAKLRYPRHYCRTRPRGRARFADITLRLIILMIVRHASRTTTMMIATSNTTW